MNRLISCLDRAIDTNCPYISFAVACDMLTMDEIRNFPSKYDRSMLSVKKVLEYMGIKSDIRVKSFFSHKDVKLNTCISDMIDNGCKFRDIAGYLRWCMTWNVKMNFSMIIHALIITVIWNWDIKGHINKRFIM